LTSRSTTSKVIPAAIMRSQTMHGRRLSAFWTFLDAGTPGQLSTARFPNRAWVSSRGGRTWA
jgi:hypothetical protein